MDGDAGSGSRQPIHQGLSYAATATGDEHNSIFELFHGVPA
jgi:hypothetical protein